MLWCFARVRCVVEIEGIEAICLGRRLFSTKKPSQISQVGHEPDTVASGFKLKPTRPALRKKRRDIQERESPESQLGFTRHLSPFRAPKCRQTCRSKLANCRRRKSCTRAPEKLVKRENASSAKNIYIYISVASLRACAQERPNGRSAVLYHSLSHPRPSRVLPCCKLLHEEDSQWPKGPMEKKKH